MNGDICKAIRSHRFLELDYNDRRRVIEPYSHGLSGDGREMLVGFQRVGGSESGQVEGWKAMAVDRIEQLVVLDVTFVPDRTDYRAGGSKNIVDVHCEV